MIDNTIPCWKNHGQTAEEAAAYFEMRLALLRVRYGVSPSTCEKALWEKGGASLVFEMRTLLMGRLSCYHEIRKNRAMRARHGKGQRSPRKGFGEGF